MSYYVYPSTPAEYTTGDITVNGTLDVTGATTLNGAVTLGDAAADAITVTGTIASNLIFTDNTYDIGASGTTRPRNLYLSGDAYIGDQLFVSGAGPHAIGGATSAAATLNLAGAQAVTGTDGATLRIAAASTGATNNYALWVDDGATRLDGAVTVGGVTTLAATLAVGDYGTYYTGADDLIVGSTTGAHGITILTEPSTGVAIIAFGSATGTAVGNASNRVKIWYDVASDELRLSAGGSLLSTYHLSITSTGVVTIPNLAGTGSRTVKADANGVLSAP